MKKIPRMICFIGFLVSATASQADITPRKILSNMEDRFSKSSTLRIEFQENFIWKLTGEQQGIGGVLILRDETRFHIETDEQVIVSDGSTLWTYSKPSAQVLIDNLGELENSMMPRQLLLQYTQEYQALLSGVENLHGKACYVLELTSDTGAHFVTHVKTWIDKKEWLPVRIEQTGLDENITVYDLKSIELDVPAGDDLFQFTIPDSVDVIDMR